MAMTASTPTLRFQVGSTVAPGDRIGSAREVAPGAGTYLRGAHIYSSSVGKLCIFPNGDAPAATSVKTGSSSTTPGFRASVVLEGGRLHASARVLFVGQIVMGQVKRISIQQAIVEIVAADGIGTLQEPHSGSIRKEDVRAGATEEVEIYASFRTGDIVLARIISLGDSRRYFLSTAESELGVIRAVCSTSKKTMIPVSWKEMECPETKTKELRKCAKPMNSSVVTTTLEEQSN